MESLDAQCLLIQLAEDEIPAPDLWCHDRSGALSCAYEGSERSFTWAAEHVASMARTWRSSHANRAPAQVRPFVEAHQHLEALAKEAGLGPADEITHHLGDAEIRGHWKNEKLVLVVERIGESGCHRVE